MARRTEPLRRLAGVAMVVMAAGASDASEHLPHVDDIVSTHILPREMRLAAATLRLQNAVVRHCTIPGPTTLGAVTESFAGVLIAAASAEPLTHTTGARRTLPERFLTGVADTAFSRSRLAAMVAGNEAPPLTLSALLAEEPALTGLPALEYLLMAPGPEPGRRERRCLMAQAIAAGLRERARTTSMAWDGGTVPEHWRENDAPLAERRRLRDLVQGGISAADRLDRLLGEFDRQTENNDLLPFSALPPNLIYIAALMEALARHVEWLTGFAEVGSEADNVLTNAGESLALARSRFNRDVQRGVALGEVRPMVGAVRLALIRRLPAAFGFDQSAFTTPLTVFADRALETDAQVEEGAEQE